MSANRAFPFVRVNERQSRPPTQGVTQIRGPYYTPLGVRDLEDPLETVGDYDARAIGFDIIGISCGFITIPPDGWLRLVERVQSAGLKARPEVGVQFAAGGASGAAALSTPAHT